MQPADFYKKLSGQTVQCQLCHHFCLIKNKQTGICRSRKNINGELYSLVYGYPVAINIDPIEKKPLFHFQPGSTSYSLGTLGCNFKCANCQNWDISQAIDLEKSIKKLKYIEPEKIVEEAINNNCSSIAYTYNEPTIFAEYALAIMEAAREKKLKNIWVSNGFMSQQCLDKILPLLDAANIDLKSLTDEFYQKNCQGRLQPVLDNLKTIKKFGVHLEITTLIIPGLADDLIMLKNLADFIVNELGTDVPWHLSRFSSSISWKLKKVPTTSEEIIFEAYDIGKNAGLKYVYVGNIPGDQRENTYCPSCGKLAIRRFGYDLERYDNHGCCPACDKNLDIIE